MFFADHEREICRSESQTTTPDEEDARRIAAVEAGKYRVSNIESSEEWEGRRKGVGFISRGVYAEELRVKNRERLDNESRYE